ncbi:methyltransferase [Alkalicella caledoniensis]|uniref:Methyltransferase n=1 Tax=Alkalicella caledoniensis TaxID=2731377 RepID=A0A7G9WA90_ALKCA|nr:methyltransferase [Alkalicella caledoniensis]QNO15602.1 methyltransferase [Alkalicella caledoniensis]
MEITRGSRMLLTKVAKDIKSPVLDYGSKNGEIAVQMDCFFADHNIANKTDIDPVKCFYVSEINEVTTSFNTAIFTAQYSLEFNNMLIEEIMEVLPLKGELLIIISKNYTLNSIEILPWKWKVVAEDNDFTIISIVKSKHFTVNRDKYLEDFTVKTNNIPVDLITDPSIFSNRELDRGTKALLEKVELKEGPLLDIGCGSGVIGIVASKLIKGKITMLDVNLRALKWAEHNAQKNNTSDYETIPNQGFKELGRKNFYQTILSNPPYHSDYSVAKEFIEEGYKMLKMGGTMWFVVKKPNWYLKKFASVFGGVKLIEHDGYSIVYGEKRPIVKKEKEKKTTKKHQKRMESTKKRRI